MMEFDPGTVSAWVGRTVRIAGDEFFDGAIVLAVDDTAYAPSAWIKIVEGRWPRYRSVDLSELTDVETGEGGPRWGAGGPDAAALLDAHHSPT